MCNDGGPGLDSPPLRRMSCAAGAYVVAALDRGLFGPPAISRVSSVTALHN